MINESVILVIILFLVDHSSMEKVVVMQFN